MRVALIEVTGSHDECLLTQLRILKNRPGTHVSLFVTPGLEGQVAGSGAVDELNVMPMNRGIRGLPDAVRLRNRLVGGRFDRVIINTCQGKAVRNLLMLPYPERMRFIGVLHHTDKLTRSTTQRLIGLRVKRYFVLSDRLVPQGHGSGPVFSYFYPIEFPVFPGTLPPKPPGEIWVCIPGQVEEKRRDYQSLLSAIETRGLPTHVRLILLGRYGHSATGRAVRARVEALGLTERILMWEDFVPNEVFHAHMRQCDAVLPLLHPESASFSMYDNRVTGAFNLAIGYGLTLLLDRSFEGISDFDGRSILYRKDELPDILFNLTTEKLPHRPADGKFAFSAQCERYWGLLSP